MGKITAALMMAMVGLTAVMAGGSVADAKALTGRHIKDKSLEGRDVKPKSLTGRHIKNRSLSRHDMRLETLTGKQIRDGSIEAADLRITPNSLDASILKTGMLSESYLTPQAVERFDYQKAQAGGVLQGSLTSPSLRDGAVRLGDLDASIWGTVSAAGPLVGRPASNLSNRGWLYFAEDQGILYRSNGSGWVQITPGMSGDIPDGAITEAKLASGAVSSGKLAEGAVSSLSILNGSITTEDLALSIIGEAHLAEGAVSSAKIKDGSISTVDIAASAITTGRLADNAIETSKILDNTILASDIGSFGSGTANGLWWATNEGGSGDTNLYRPSADVLRTDDTLSVGGGMVMKRRSVATSTTLATDDYMVSANAAPLTLTLPSAASAGNGRSLRIKDGTGSASANPITIQAAGGELIDGSPSITISSNYQALTLVSTGSAWEIW